MTSFEPIAIVGEGCVLPGALSADALWQMIIEKRSAIKSPPAKAFGLTAPEMANLHYVSGFVQGFEKVFDPGRYHLFGIDAEDLDPVCKWPLHASMQAWIEAGSPKVAPEKCGVFVANLSYPSRGHAAYASAVWANDACRPPPEHVFNSALPARYIAESIGATGPAFALDAACASSLYGLEIACRRLQSRQLDCALVAGVNAADNLILHLGFEALKALSPSGRSRPFIKGADGLVPSEGAVAVVLKRLSDVEPGETVRGVIRGIGLSNDGRRKGLLAPDASGQCEAMRRAYAGADIDPTSIDYLECHATGTPTGDGVEIGASAQVFAGSERLPVGSLKANTGHLITVAGLAGLLKLTQGMAHETLPPTPLAGKIIDGFDGTPLIPLGEAAEWCRAGATRRASISNFGFGGNNAHLILEQYEASNGAVPVSKPPESPGHQDDIVICGLGLLAGADRGTEAVLRRLMNHPVKPVAPCTRLATDPMTARTPPNDLDEAEPQQLAILETVDEALADIQVPALERCGVFVGMTCAADSARWLLRERLAERFGLSPGTTALKTAKASVAPPLTAATVLGAMANMTANRVSYSRDFRGPSFSVSAEHASGLAALELACDALRSGQLDLALAAAADFANEPVRREALTALGQGTQTGDLAGTLVLKRRKDAKAAGDRIYATVSDLKWVADDAASQASPLRDVFGTAPAADLVFAVAVEALLTAHGQGWHEQGAVSDLSGTREATVVKVADGVLNSGGAVTLLPDAPLIVGDPLRPPPFLFWAAAKTRELLANRLAEGKPGGRGRCRIAIVQANAEEQGAALALAQRELARGQVPQGDGVHYGEGRAEGEMALMFTGSAAVYPRMARRLLMAFPDVVERLSKLDKANEIAPLLAKSSLTEFEQLCAGTLVSQAHSILLQNVLGLKPEAALGLSLGESNALFAFGVWRDAGKLLDEISDAAMYERHLGGDFETARQSWGANVPSDWSNWRLHAPIAAVKDAISGHDGVEITIIYSDVDCMIGGPGEACKAICEKLGPGSGARMQQHLIVHAKAMQPFAETWRKLHTRRVHSGSEVRFYTNATNAAYTPTRQRVADMLTRQAVTTVDFPATIKQAWEDGVRTFVELGPRDTLSQSIASILDEQAHLSVACDRIEASDLGQIAHLAAVLFANGRKLKIGLVAEQLEAARQGPAKRARPKSSGRAVPYPAVVLPVSASGVTGLPKAPILPPPVYPVSEVAKPCRGPTVFPPAPGEAMPSPVLVTSGVQALHQRTPSGPHWNRAALEASTRGLMSDLFGAAFKPQDGYARQVRLPAPPLLLVDRITGIDAEPGVDGRGVIWTETDLKAQDWFIHEGRIRSGMLIECGQADLTLIGWMGADLRNQDERVYRLLGCEIVFHEGGMPKAGDTLKFQIEITGHATLAGVRMFFFQYDCRVGDRRVFSVRNGQAGFFTDQELASGKGVVWDAEKDPAPTANPVPFTPIATSQKTAFSPADMAAYRAGDVMTCFGPGFELSAAHSQGQKLPDGKLALLDEVTVFDPAGGAWQRGYLKARKHVPADDWLYEGHFHNDPCMPGTLMAEAAVQALEFYAAAIGLTLARDGYVFEPIPGHTAKFVCRGQVIPDRDHEVTYEVFVDEVIDGDTPVIYASLLARCDGHKVFHCPRYGVRLRRYWPAARVDKHPLRIGPLLESRGDQAALLDCANGAPSAAFGEMYAPFDEVGEVPRLPQPPYHMITRVTDVSSRPGVQEKGVRVRAEYDVLPKAWYFKANRNGTMPFAVLSEIALQPCGWLASHCGFALGNSVRFRNLEGEGHLHAEVLPDAGTLTIESTLVSFSKVGPMTIVSFELQVCFADGRRVLDLKTQFGFFPASALARQAGLPVRADWNEYVARPGKALKLRKIDKRLAKGQLCMLDHVDLFDPEGGTAGLGIIRGQQSVDPEAWYFKAHFFQDPVQPGSLGLDALSQLLARAVLLKELDAGMAQPHIETIATDAPIKWSYRGEVTPKRKRVTTLIEIISIEPRSGGFLITAHGSLWRDGLRVYEVKPMCIALTDKG